MLHVLGRYVRERERGLRMRTKNCYIMLRLKRTKPASVRVLVRARVVGIYYSGSYTMASYSPLGPLVTLKQRGVATTFRNIKSHLLEKINYDPSGDENILSYNLTPVDLF